MEKIKVVLASSSPRRQEILNMLGIPFTVHVPETDEHVDGHPAPDDFVREVSGRKCAAVRDAISPDENTVIVACDTVVVADGRILGKPADLADATATLHLLSGGKHAVLTGMTLHFHGQTVQNVCHTQVMFRPLTEREINAYVASGEPMGKAGSYAIQKKASSFVESIEGDYFNIVGFPISLFFRLLREDFGVESTDLMNFEGTC